MPLQATLPTFESQLDQVARAERGDGWLCACEEHGQFLAPTQELVTALAESLRDLHAGPILEVCAGRGELAEAVRTAGVNVVATDADPPPDAPVTRASAEEALHRYRPAVVLGSFVPVDASVDELALRFPSVRHYVVLGARIGGVFGSPALWGAPTWTAEPLDEVGRWMVTRHDVWVPGSPPRIVLHGEAWHFRAKKTPVPSAGPT